MVESCVSYDLWLGLGNMVDNFFRYYSKYSSLASTASYSVFIYYLFIDFLEDCLREVFTKFRIELRHSIIVCPTVFFFLFSFLLLFTVFKIREKSNFPHPCRNLKFGRVARILKKKRSYVTHSHNRSKSRIKIREINMYLRPAWRQCAHVIRNSINRTSFAILRLHCLFSIYSSEIGYI